MCTTELLFLVFLIWLLTLRYLCKQVANTVVCIIVIPLALFTYTKEGNGEIFKVLLSHLLGTS